MEPTSKGQWPAFPAMHYDLAEHEHGMTLRDYFAAKAMSYWLSLPIDKEQLEISAAQAYNVADAMMKERNNAAQ